MIGDKQANFDQLCTRTKEHVGDIENRTGWLVAVPSES